MKLLTKYVENCHNKSLLAIQNIVISIGGNPLTQYGLPTQTIDGEQNNRKYASEINYDSEELAKTLQNGCLNLTPEQRPISDRVCCSVDNVLEEILFLDESGRTGKTFLTKVILARIRSQNKSLVGNSSHIIAWRGNHTYNV